MKIKFASELNKMIDAGLGLSAEAPETNVAVGQRLEYVDIGPAPQLIFETNVALPLRAFTLYLAPLQSGSGVPSPDNIRPISGRTAVMVTVNGAEYTEDLGQTVYGGTLDLITGTLAIDRAIVDISQFTYYSEDISEGGLHWSHYRAPVTKDSPAIASMLPFNQQGWSSTTDCIDVLDGMIRIYTTADSIAAMKARYPDMTICYTINTPVIVQLTARQISAIIGSNTILSAAGDVSASYGIIKYTEGY